MKKLLILHILLFVFTIVCNAQIHETSTQTNRVGYTTNYGNSFKQPAQVNNDFGTSFNSVNIHRNGIITGGGVYTLSIMRGGTVYYSPGSSGTRPGGPRRSPERPFSGKLLEDLEDYARMNGILGFGYDPDWPGYVDEGFWEQFLSVYPEYEPYARQWFESHGQHFPLDPYADPILDLPIGLFVVLMIGYCFYRKRKTVSV